MTKRYGTTTSLGDIFAEQISPEESYRDIHNRYFKYLQKAKFTWYIIMPCGHTITYSDYEKPVKCWCITCPENYDIKAEFEKKSDVLMELDMRG